MRRSDDGETLDRIRRHKVARGTGWTTSEIPIEVVPHLARIEGGTVLVDCATLWLANLMEAGGDPWSEPGAWAAALAEARPSVVVVSNELGQGIVPMDAGTRAFRDAHGRMNQALAARAGLVVLVTAGLPLVLKGSLPR